MGRDMESDTEGVLDANRRMFLNQIRTDIHFVIKYEEEDEKTIGCHQYVLCSRSRVFETMVYGAVPLSEEELKKGILINDIPFDIFKLFLQFVYYEHLELSPDNVIPLLYAAKKYMVMSLEKQCSSYLQTLTKTQNACLILDQSLLFDQIELIETARKLIQMNTLEALESETLLDIGHETLCDLLTIPSLSCSERQVFQACVRWAEAKLSRSDTPNSPPQIRNLLEEPLKLIHFGSFSLEELADTVARSNLLSGSEFEMLRKQISTKTANPECPFKVSVRQRYHGRPIRFLFKSSYGMMQRQTSKAMHVSLQPTLPIQLKRIILDLEDYSRSDFALTIHTPENIYREDVPHGRESTIELSREVRVEAGTELKLELFVRSSLPITLTVQTELTTEMDGTQLDSALKMDVTEASRGAGAVFKAIDVLPLAL